MGFHWAAHPDSKLKFWDQKDKNGLKQDSFDNVKDDLKRSISDNVSAVEDKSILREKDNNECEWRMMGGMIAVVWESVSRYCYTSGMWL